MRVLGYVTPHINIEGDLYKEGEAKDFYMKNSTGHNYIMDFGQFFVATVDLTNPDAYEWYKGKLTFFETLYTILDKNDESGIVIIL